MNSKKAFAFKKCVAENSVAISASKYVNISSKSIRKNIDGYSINTFVADFESVFAR